VIHLNVGGQVYDLTWGTIKNKKIAAIEIPVIENGSPEAKNFYSFTRGVHSKLSGAQTAARKYMKGGEDEVVILHTPEGRMNQEYWAVGYLKINKEASKIHRNNKNGYIDLVSGGWGVEIHSKTKPESGDKVFIDLSYLDNPPTDQTFAEEIVDKVLSESRDLKNSIKYICSIQSQDQVKSIMGINKEASKKKEKLDPKADVRNMGDVCFPANKANDKKDHFPINSLTQARNALSQVAKYTKVPSWYNGSLKGLVETVKKKVHGKYPSIKSEKKN